MQMNPLISQLYQTAITFATFPTATSDLALTLMSSLWEQDQPL